MKITRRYLTHLVFLLCRKKRHMLIVLLLATVSLILIKRQFGPPYTGSKYNFYVMLFGEPELPGSSQADIDYIATKLQVNFSIVYSTDLYHLANFTFVNTGSRTISPQKWQLYLYSLNLVEFLSYPYPHGFYISSCPLRVYHFNGFTYWLEPVARYFRGMEQGDSLTCLLKVKYVQESPFQSMPNWYVTGYNLVPKVLTCTTNEDMFFVGSMPEKHALSDSTSASVRYDSFAYTKPTFSAHVIPTPLEIDVDQDARLEWNTSHWVVVKSGPFPTSARYLSEKLKLQLVVSQPRRRCIVFHRNDIDLSNFDVKPEEAYTVTSDARSERIDITATTEAGAFYGVQTLLSMLLEKRAPTDKKAFYTIPSFMIKDAPRYHYRGLHVDVARNFLSPDEIKKILKVMAMYKMNKLHLHLSDDEGWRLEIPGIPELTKIGSTRCHEPLERRCVMSTLGSGPDQTTSGTGFYDTETYKALLRYANNLHVEVIPEFDLPGHSRAAILSLHSGTPGQGSGYVVKDQEDDAGVMSGQHVKGNAMNPCMSGTYQFVKKLMTEVKLLHEGIQPLKVFHFGGDEVAENAWETSSSCEQLARQNPDLSSHYNKMKYFVSRVSKLASENSLSLGAWEDGVLSHDNVIGVPFPRKQLPNKDVYVYIWKHLIQPQTPHRLRLLANSGYKVVMAYASYFYFDHPYEADPMERGLRWAASDIALRRVWNFSPKMSSADAHLDCPSSVTDTTDCFKLKKPENIVGIQAELWTETVRTSDQADYMLFPRLLAVAERAWHTGAWEEPGQERLKTEEYARFVDLVGRKEIGRLEQLDVKYRVAPPGVRMQSGKLLYRTEFPGQDVEYFDSREGNWTTAVQYMPIQQPTKLRTRTSDGRRYSREVILTSGSDSSVSKLNIITIVYGVMLYADKSFSFT